MFGSFDISTSALTAQRVRMETISSNLANIQTTRDAQGNLNPYRRLMVQFQPQNLSTGGTGVNVAKIVEDPSAFKPKYEPWNPDHDAAGYVNYPNVDLSTENINALEASRAYEANVTALETTKSMLSATLRILA